VPLYAWLPRRIALGAELIRFSAHPP
jgi:hypothetical protein